MVKNPSGDPARCESALKELARHVGPVKIGLRRLLDYTEDVAEEHRELARLVARPLGSLAVQRQADCLLRVVREEIDNVADERWKEGVALRTVFRASELDEPSQSNPEAGIYARLKLANESGEFRRPVHPDTCLRYWLFGVRNLGRRLDRRLAELQEPDAWAPYLGAPDDAGPIAVGEDSAEPPASGAQRVFVKRLVATYGMKGRAVNYAISERTVVALDAGVDRYRVRARSPRREGGADAPVIRARLNCRAGEVQLLPSADGPPTHEVAMIFPQPLKANDEIFFASAVSGQQDTTPLVEVQVTSHGIAANGLTLRVQFDREQLPAAAWWFAECLDDYRLVKPPEGDVRRLTWSSLGYVEYTFTRKGKYGHRYGIGWAWS
ncbi:hypothetical protein [Actinomycetospora flava]|uniref:Uncharacterized protein n=1 Tax=Actinomycetospora flava TaxID=3129232 RepID=A0ABU8MFV2_9PSEU